MNLPTTHVGMVLTTPLPRQSIWNPFPAVWSWQPRGQFVVGITLIGRSRSVGLIVREDQPHPVLISPCSQPGHYCTASKAKTWTTKTKITQSEIVKGLSRPGKSCQQDIKCSVDHEPWHVPGPSFRDTESATVSPCDLLVPIS